MEKNKRRRYRLSDETAECLGLQLNKNRRYRLSVSQELEFVNGKSGPRILIYDIETSRMLAKTWWTGKQYVGSNQVVREPKIITIAWKWFGTDEVKYVSWDKNHDDKELLKKFLHEYNRADLVIGQNNDKFDNRWINARALKHRLDVNMLVRSLDLMKQAKKHFRLPGYSMKFMTEFMGVETKMEHEGIKMWDMIEDGTKEEQAEYMQKMIDYNVQDIVATEQMYLMFRKYIGTVTHLGMFSGGDKSDCPSCASDDVEHRRVTYTAAGTLQHIMRCKDCGTEYKVSNRTYLNFLESERIYE